jgi:hypothetical protein
MKTKIGVLGTGAMAVRGEQDETSSPKHTTGNDP